MKTITVAEAQINYDRACETWRKTCAAMHESGNWMLYAVRESHDARSMSDAAQVLIDTKAATETTGAK